MCCLRRFSLRVLIAACCVYAGNTAAAALPVGAVEISDDQVFQTSNNGKTVTCASISGRWLPGKLVGSAKDRFLSHAQDLKNLKVNLRKAPAAKKSKIAKKMTSVKALNSAQSSVCRNGPGSSNPGATPTPSPTTNFDNSGNVTSEGKTAFSIPSNLSGNITTGKGIHTSFACTSCHGEKTGKSYTQIKAAINEVSAMAFYADQSTDQDIAQITAYLNRFKM